MRIKQNEANVEETLNHEAQDITRERKVSPPGRNEELVRVELKEADLEQNCLEGLLIGNGRVETSNILASWVYSIRGRAKLIREGQGR